MQSPLGVPKIVLVIDDDFPTCQAIRDVLELHGYEVRLARDGQDGLDQLRAMTPIPALIILDMLMPRLNGWQFLDQQRASPEHSMIPVVVCSGMHETARTVQSTAFLRKPFDFEELLRLVRQHGR